MIINDVFYFVSSFSVLLNFFFIILLLKYRKFNKKRKDSYESSELIKDLLSGEALIKITRISPTDVFLRSPRGK